MATAKRYSLHLNAVHSQWLDTILQGILVGQISSNARANVWSEFGDLPASIYVAAFFLAGPKIPPFIPPPLPTPSPHSSSLARSVLNFCPVTTQGYLRGSPYVRPALPFYHPYILELNLSAAQLWQAFRWWNGIGVLKCFVDPIRWAVESKNSGSGSFLCAMQLSSVTHFA